MEAPLIHGLKVAPQPSFGHLETSLPKLPNSFSTHPFNSLLLGLLAASFRSDSQHASHLNFH
eukprot:4294109-Lingulodinium_polyedra.AAC.1